MRCYDRATGWAELRLQSRDAVLELTVVSVRLHVAALYRGVSLSESPDEA